MVKMLNLIGGCYPGAGNWISISADVGKRNHDLYDPKFLHIG